MQVMFNHTLSGPRQNDETNLYESCQSL